MDESGDHGLANINPQYPIFVLSACIFLKQTYRSDVVPRFLELKFKYWNHDMVIFHSRDIRKAQEKFSILQNAVVRTAFLAELDTSIDQSDFTVVSAIINKQALTSQYTFPDNPYDIALTFCLERCYGFLKDRAKHDQETTVVVECRGNKEDKDLEAAFTRIVDGSSQWRCKLPFNLVFADKKVNSTGMQLADLVSFPIGRNYINPTQQNVAYNTVEKKLRRSNKGVIQGYGRKAFPA